jgi:prolyl-tRNA synthetase
MDVTHKILEDEFAIPIIFFQRPEWDKFPGAVHTYAADALMDSGRVIQLPSSHLLGTNFSKPFNVKFVDRDGIEKYGYITCYGPAISRIYGAMIASLGDDRGLVLPFDLAPLQIVIVPIIFKDSASEVLERCEAIGKMLGEKYLVKVDSREGIRSGEKFNEWELKGVPIRIEIGPKDLQRIEAVVVTRHDRQKRSVKLDELQSAIDHIAKNYTYELKNRQMALFKDYIVRCETLEDENKIVYDKKMACTGFCSLEKESAECAGVIEKELGAFVRGKKIGREEHHFSKCVVCGKPATETVYIARSY